MLGNGTAGKTQICRQLRGLGFDPQVPSMHAVQLVSLHHHSLTYWLDYVRSLAGEKAAIIVVQAPCDKESDRTTPPLPEMHGFTRPPAVVTCSAKTGEMDELRAGQRSATRYLLEALGKGR